jgi:branched-chain amino acid aminotransferase
MLRVFVSPWLVSVARSVPQGVRCISDMSATVNVNGRITSDGEATISVFDHGFLYGEGIYETMRTYHRRAFLYDRHMRRLRRSAKMIELPLPFTDAQLAAQIRDTQAIAKIDGEVYIRVLVTRGIGDLTYDVKATPNPSIVIIVKPQVDPPPEVYDKGVRVVIVDVVRNHPDSVNPMIKSNNLMNSALAMQEALRTDAFEGVMRNYRGELTECTTSNLFIVKNGVALTPPLEAGLLPGITREFLFDVGKEIGVDVREQVMRDDDLFGADEAFLTSTTREAVPIVTVNDRTIGSGKPGPVTWKLLEGFRKAAEAS